MKQDEYLHKLPENLRVIIQLTDYRTAMILIEQFGGSDYKFPPLKTITESHELAELLGFNNLKNYVSIGMVISYIFPNLTVILVFYGINGLSRIWKKLGLILKHRSH